MKEFKGFWYAKKSTIAGLILYGIVFFLILYQYPLIGAVNDPTLFLGAPKFLIYIWAINTLYIIFTAALVYLMIFKRAPDVEIAEGAKERGGKLGGGNQ